MTEKFGLTSYILAVRQRDGTVSLWGKSVSLASLTDTIHCYDRVTYV